MVSSKWNALNTYNVQEIHYTTIAFIPEKGQWYNFNDDKVRPIKGDPSFKNLGDDRNVPVLFFYTLYKFNTK